MHCNSIINCINFCSDWCWPRLFRRGWPQKDYDHNRLGYLIKIWLVCNDLPNTSELRVYSFGNSQIRNQHPQIDQNRLSKFIHRHFEKKWNVLVPLAMAYSTPALRLTKEFKIFTFPPIFNISLIDFRFFKKESLNLSRHPYRIFAPDSYDFIRHKVRENIKNSFGQKGNPPINAKSLKVPIPVYHVHRPTDKSWICPGKVPNFAFVWRRKRNF